MKSDIINKQNFDVMKAVYCYFFPEVRPIIREVESRISDEFYFVTSKAKDVEKSLETLFEKPLIIPETIDGRVNLDEVHVPIIERIVNAYSNTVPALSKFNYSYPTAGSSEGIFHLLVGLKKKGVEEINVFKGEYEGYEAQAKNIGLCVNVVNRKNASKIENGHFFISNPSAIDGNIITNEEINKICDNGNKVVIDLAYVGGAREYTFDISHENIEAAVMSFSKPYGVFRFRIGGFTFSKDEIPTLYGNKWFKDTTRLFQALKIAEDIGPEKLHARYEPLQKKIITSLNEKFGLNIRQSDALLLGYLKNEDTKLYDEKKLELIEPFKRGDGYRFCLTPYFEKFEKGN